jgi:hypothetical protein
MLVTPVGTGKVPEVVMVVVVCASASLAQTTMLMLITKACIQLF